MNEYEKQAKDFLKNCGAKMTISFKSCGKYFNDDKDARNIYRVRIDRNNQTFSFSFGDSICNTINGKRPTAYDILACLTKYRPEDDVWDFAKEYGYTIEDKASYQSTERTFSAVWKEYQGVMRLFEDVIDELREIQ